MKTLIKNGMVYHEGHIRKLDILIEGTLISKVASQIEDKQAAVIDAKGKHVFPGFVDIHAHLRDPGHTYKEDIVSGTHAAAHGGVTSLCAMPNTEPVVDNIAAVDYVQRRAKDLGYAKVYVIAAMTKDSLGKEISEMATMKAGGIVGVSDDGNCVQDSKLMLNCMRYARNFDLPVIIHAEDYSLAGKGQINAGIVATRLGLSGLAGLAEETIIARDIMLAEAAGVKLHIAHISTAHSIEMVRDAKERGLDVSCEVTPHHLILTEEACLEYNTNTKMKPPLRTEADRQACIRGLIDGTIDCIATDHAPHADFEKSREFDRAPFGIIGFETAFPALYHYLVKPGIVMLERIVEAYSLIPAQLMGLPENSIKAGNAADITIVDLQDESFISEDFILSKSKNTPWLNQRLASKITHTIVDGRISWQED